MCKEERTPETPTVLPELTCENLEALMKERIAATENKKTVVPVLWQGLLELDIDTDGGKRKAKYYIPKDISQGTTAVILNIPEGEETLSFLKKSGWIELADRERFCLFILEAGPGGWGTPEEEEEYLRAGVEAEKNGQHILLSFAVCMVGYGRIGSVLHKIAMSDPLHTAACVFFDAGEVEETYLAEYEEKCFTPEEADDKSYCVPYREVPVPVWIASGILDTRTLAMAEYWKRAARTGDIPGDSEFGEMYRQQEDTLYTPEGHILQVAVQKKAFAYHSPDTTEAAWRFLKQYYRYGMGPCSNMISKKTDLKTLGAECRQFYDSRGTKRQYLVYIPEAYKDSGRLPTVIAYHGASQSMYNMLENGLWYRIADREGIMLVFPESTLQPLPDMLTGDMPFAYRPLWTLFDTGANGADLVYTNELLDEIIREYPVDESRIYCTGHSMGCMMTNYIGSDITSHRFAAMAATSGCLELQTGTGTQKVPAFLTAGQYELWLHGISEEGPIEDSIDMWLVRNQLATEETAREIREHGYTEAYQEGRLNNYVWKDEKGIPWVRYAWISAKHHVHTWQENEIFWKEWFSRWHIGKDGRRCYEEERKHR